MPYYRLLPLFVYMLTFNLAYSLDREQEKINNATNKLFLAELDRKEETASHDKNSSNAPVTSSDKKDNLSWEFGINLNINQLNGNFGGSWSIQLGKDLIESQYLFYGVQTHIGFSSGQEIKYNDDLNFEQASLFGTARVKQISALQFKAGITHAKYNTLSVQDSGTGFSYGIAIVTELSPHLRVHWLDYEKHDINNQSFSTISFNIVILLCAFSGGHC